MNYWKEIAPGTKESINVIIEIPRGSKNKYEVDKETGLIALDRAMHTAQDYPFDYGFIPQTYWEDNDPVDVVLLSTYPLSPGILVRARAVGVMNMIDGGEADDKLICVPTDDPRFEEVQDLNDVNKHTLKEMEHFFSTYKKLQHKEVEVTGFKGKKEADEVFEKGIKLYKEEFGQ